MLRPALALVAALAVLALPTAASAEPDPMAGAPTVGDCFDITYAQGMARSLSEAPVDCSSGHTAVVTAVGELPEGVDWDSSPEEINAAEAPVCKRGLAELIGFDPLRYYRSTYQALRFEPTRAQRADGARWFDCMISVFDARGLPDLPDTLPRLTKNLPDSVARCVTKKMAFTRCADAHQWRSSYAFFATGKATDRHAARVAAQTCPRHVTGRNWLQSSIDVEGRRFMVACYSKTRR